MDRNTHMSIAIHGVHARGQAKDLKFFSSTYKLYYWYYTRSLLLHGSQYSYEYCDPWSARARDPWVHARTQNILNVCPVRTNSTTPLLHGSQYSYKYCDWWSSRVCTYKVYYSTNRNTHVSIAIGGVNSTSDSTYKVYYSTKTNTHMSIAIGGL